MPFYEQLDYAMTYKRTWFYLMRLTHDIVSQNKTVAIDIGESNVYSCNFNKYFDFVTKSRHTIIVPLITISMTHVLLLNCHILMRSILQV